MFSSSDDPKLIKEAVDTGLRAINAFRKSQPFTYQITDSSLPIVNGTIWLLHIDGSKCQLNKYTESHINRLLNAGISKRMTLPLLFLGNYFLWQQGTVDRDEEKAACSQLAIALLKLAQHRDPACKSAVNEIVLPYHVSLEENLEQNKEESFGSTEKAKLNLLTEIAKQIKDIKNLDAKGEPLQTAVAHSIGTLNIHRLRSKDISSSLVNSTIQSIEAFSQHFFSELKTLDKSLGGKPLQVDLYEAILEKRQIAQKLSELHGYLGLEKEYNLQTLLSAITNQDIYARLQFFLALVSKIPSVEGWIIKTKPNNKIKKVKKLLQDIEKEYEFECTLSSFQNHQKIISKNAEKYAALPKRIRNTYWGDLVNYGANLKDLGLLKTSPSAENPGELIWGNVSKILHNHPEHFKSALANISRYADRITYAIKKHEHATVIMYPKTDDEKLFTSTRFMAEMTKQLPPIDLSTKTKSMEESDALLSKYNLSFTENKIPQLMSLMGRLTNETQTLKELYTMMFDAQDPRIVAFLALYHLIYGPYQLSELFFKLAIDCNYPPKQLVAVLKDTSFAVKNDIIKEALERVKFIEWFKFDKKIEELEEESTVSGQHAINVIKLKTSLFKLEVSEMQAFKERVVTRISRLYPKTFAALQKLQKCGPMIKKFTENNKESFIIEPFASAIKDSLYGSKISEILNHQFNKEEITVAIADTSFAEFSLLIADVEDIDDGELASALTTLENNYLSKQQENFQNAANHFPTILKEYISILDTYHINDLRLLLLSQDEEIKKLNQALIKCGVCERNNFFELIQTHSIAAISKVQKGRNLFQLIADLITLTTTLKANLPASENSQQLKKDFLSKRLAHLAKENRDLEVSNITPYAIQVKDKATGEHTFKADISIEKIQGLMWLATSKNSTLRSRDKKNLLLFLGISYTHKMIHTKNELYSPVDPATTLFHLAYLEGASLEETFKIIANIKPDSGYMTTHDNTYPDATDLIKKNLNLAIFRQLPLTDIDKKLAKKLNQSTQEKDTSSFPRGKWQTQIKNKLSFEPSISSGLDSSYRDLLCQKIQAKEVNLNTDEGAKLAATYYALQGNAELAYALYSSFNFIKYQDKVTHEEVKLLKNYWLNEAYKKNYPQAIKETINISLNDIIGRLKDSEEIEHNLSKKYLAWTCVKEPGVFSEYQKKSPDAKNALLAASKADQSPEELIPLTSNVLEFVIKAHDEYYQNQIRLLNKKQNHAFTEQLQQLEHIANHKFFSEADDFKKRIFISLYLKIDFLIFRKRLVDIMITLNKLPPKHKALNSFKETLNTLSSPATWLNNRQDTINEQLDAFEQEVNLTHKLSQFNNLVTALESIKSEPDLALFKLENVNDFQLTFASKKLFIVETIKQRFKDVDSTFTQSMIDYLTTPQADLQAVLQKINEKNAGALEKMVKELESAYRAQVKNDSIQLLTLYFSLKVKLDAKSKEERSELLSPSETKTLEEAYALISSATVESSTSHTTLNKGKPSSQSLERSVYEAAEQSQKTAELITKVSHAVSILAPKVEAMLSKEKEDIQTSKATLEKEISAATALYHHLSSIQAPKGRTSFIFKDPITEKQQNLIIVLQALKKEVDLDKNINIGKKFVTSCINDDFKPYLSDQLKKIELLNSANYNTLNTEYASVTSASQALAFSTKINKEITDLLDIKRLQLACLQPEKLSKNNQKNVLKALEDVKDLMQHSNGITVDEFKKTLSTINQTMDNITFTDLITHIAKQAEIGTIDETKAADYLGLMGGKTIDDVYKQLDEEGLQIDTIKHLNVSVNDIFTETTPFIQNIPLQVQILFLALRGHNNSRFQFISQLFDKKNIKQSQSDPHIRNILTLSIYMSEQLALEDNADKDLLNLFDEIYESEELGSSISLEQKQSFVEKIKKSKNPEFTKKANQFIEQGGLTGVSIIDRVLQKEAEIKKLDEREIVIYNGELKTLDLVSVGSRPPSSTRPNAYVKGKTENPVKLLKKQIKFQKTQLQTITTSYKNLYNMILQDLNKTSATASQENKSEALIALEDNLAKIQLYCSSLVTQIDNPTSSDQATESDITTLEKNSIQYGCAALFLHLVKKFKPVLKLDLPEQELKDLNTLIETVLKNCADVTHEKYFYSGPTVEKLKNAFTFYDQKQKYTKHYSTLVQIKNLKYFTYIDTERNVLSNVKPEFFLEQSEANPFREKIEKLQILLQRLLRNHYKKASNDFNSIHKALFNPELFFKEFGHLIEDGSEIQVLRALEDIATTYEELREKSLKKAYGSLKSELKTLSNHYGKMSQILISENEDIKASIATFTLLKEKLTSLNLITSKQDEPLWHFTFTKQELDVNNEEQKENGYENLQDLLTKMQQVRTVLDQHRNLDKHADYTQRDKVSSALSDQIEAFQEKINNTIKLYGSCPWNNPAIKLHIPKLKEHTKLLHDALSTNVSTQQIIYAENTLKNAKEYLATALKSAKDHEAEIIKGYQAKITENITKLQTLEYSLPLDKYSKLQMTELTDENWQLYADALADLNNAIKDEVATKMTAFTLAYEEAYKAANTLSLTSQEAKQTLDPVLEKAKNDFSNLDSFKIITKSRFSSTTTQIFYKSFLQDATTTLSDFILRYDELKNGHAKLCAFLTKEVSEYKVKEKAENERREKLKEIEEAQKQALEQEQKEKAARVLALEKAKIVEEHKKNIKRSETTYDLKIGECKKLLDHFEDASEEKTAFITQQEEAAKALTETLAEIPAEEVSDKQVTAYSKAVSQLDSLMLEAKNSLAQELKKSLAQPLAMYQASLNLAETTLGTTLNNAGLEAEFSKLGITKDTTEKGLIDALITTEIADFPDYIKTFSENLTQTAGENNEHVETVFASAKAAAEIKLAQLNASIENLKEIAKDAPVPSTTEKRTELATAKTMQALEQFNKQVDKDIKDVAGQTSTTLITIFIPVIESLQANVENAETLQIEAQTNPIVSEAAQQLEISSELLQKDPETIIKTIFADISASAVIFKKVEASFDKLDDQLSNKINKVKKEKAQTSFDEANDQYKNLVAPLLAAFENEASNALIKKYEEINAPSQATDAPATDKDLEIIMENARKLAEINKEADALIREKAKEVLETINESYKVGSNANISAETVQAKLAEKFQVNPEELKDVSVASLCKLFSTMKTDKLKHVVETQKIVQKDNVKFKQGLEANQYKTSNLVPKVQNYRKGKEFLTKLDPGLAAASDTAMMGKLQEIQRNALLAGQATQVEGLEPVAKLAFYTESAGIYEDNATQVDQKIDQAITANITSLINKYQDLISQANQFSIKPDLSRLQKLAPILAINGDNKITSSFEQICIALKTNETAEEFSSQYEELKAALTEAKVNTEKALNDKLEEVKRLYEAQTKIISPLTARITKLDRNTEDPIAKNEQEKSLIPAHDIVALIKFFESATRDLPTKVASESKVKTLLTEKYKAQFAPIQDAQALADPNIAFPQIKEIASKLAINLETASLAKVQSEFTLEKVVQAMSVLNAEEFNTVLNNLPEALSEAKGQIATAVVKENLSAVETNLAEAESRLRDVYAEYSSWDEEAIEALKKADAESNQAPEGETAEAKALRLQKRMTEFIPAQIRKVEATKDQTLQEVTGIARSVNRILAKSANQKLTIPQINAVDANLPTDTLATYCQNTGAEQGLTFNTQQLVADLNNNPGKRKQILADLKKEEENPVFQQKIMVVSWKQHFENKFKTQQDNITRLTFVDKKLAEKRQQELDRDKEKIANHKGPLVDRIKFFEDQNNSTLTQTKTVQSETNNNLINKFTPYFDLTQKMAVPGTNEGLPTLQDILPDNIKENLPKDTDLTQVATPENMVQVLFNVNIEAFNEAASSVENTLTDTTKTQVVAELTQQIENNKKQAELMEKVNPELAKTLKEQIKKDEEALAAITANENSTFTDVSNIANGLGEREVDGVDPRTVLTNKAKALKSEIATIIKLFDQLSDAGIEDDEDITQLKAQLGLDKSSITTASGLLRALEKLDEPAFNTAMTGILSLPVKNAAFQTKLTDQQVNKATEELKKTATQVKTKITRLVAILPEAQNELEKHDNDLEQTLATQGPNKVGVLKKKNRNLNKQINKWEARIAETLQGKLEEPVKTYNLVLAANKKQVEIKKSKEKEKSSANSDNILQVLNLPSDKELSINSLRDKLLATKDADKFKTQFEEVIAYLNTKTQEMSEEIAENQISPAKKEMTEARLKLEELANMTTRLNNAPSERLAQKWHKLRKEIAAMEASPENMTSVAIASKTKAIQGLIEHFNQLIAGTPQNQFQTSNHADSAAQVFLGFSGQVALNLIPLAYRRDNPPADSIDNMIIQLKASLENPATDEKNQTSDDLYTYWKNKLRPDQFSSKLLGSGRLFWINLRLTLPIFLSRQSKDNYNDSIRQHHLAINAKKILIAAQTTLEIKILPDAKRAEQYVKSSSDYEVGQRLKAEMIKPTPPANTKPKPPAVVTPAQAEKIVLDKSIQEAIDLPIDEAPEAFLRVAQELKKQIADFLWDARHPGQGLLKSGPMQLGYNPKEEFVTVKAALKDLEGKYSIFLENVSEKMRAVKKKQNRLKPKVYEKQMREVLTGLGKTFTEHKQTYLKQLPSEALPNIPQYSAPKPKKGVTTPQKGTVQQKYQP